MLAQETRWSGAKGIIYIYDPETIWQAHSFGDEIPIEICTNGTLDKYIEDVIRELNKVDMEKAPNKHLQRLKNWLRNASYYGMFGDQDYFRRLGSEGYISLDNEYLTPSMVKNYIKAKVADIEFRFGKPRKVIHAVPVAWLQNGSYNNEAVLTTGELATRRTRTIIIKDEDMKLSVDYSDYVGVTEPTLYEFMPDGMAMPSSVREFEGFAKESKGKQILVGGRIRSRVLIADLFNIDGRRFAFVL